LVRASGGVRTCVLLLLQLVVLDTHASPHTLTVIRAKPVSVPRCSRRLSGCDQGVAAKGMCAWCCVLLVLLLCDDGVVVLVVVVCAAAAMKLCGGKARAGFERRRTALQSV
jgi:hypothetical protein